MIDTDKYEGHTPAPWNYNSEEGREIWKCLYNGESFTDPSTYGKKGYEAVPIATMTPLPEGEDFSDEEFTTMMANKMLMADAPKLLAEVKRLREGIGKVADNMAKLVEAYSSHLADEEVADWISGFTKDVLELIE